MKNYRSDDQSDMLPESPALTPDPGEGLYILARIIARHLVTEKSRSYGSEDTYHDINNTDYPTGEKESHG